jgi:hypothetical protein
MPGYIFCAFDTHTETPGDFLDVNFSDCWELQKLRGDLEEAAVYGDRVGAMVPSRRAVAALPSFDPESWGLLVEEPGWTLFCGDGGGWCGPDTLRSYLDAMNRLDGCVTGGAAVAWSKLKAAFEQLVSGDLGFYCSSDE